ncbi:MAG: SPOR domain-containing protein [Sulfitobacter sp.]
MANFTHAPMAGSYPDATGYSDTAGTGSNPLVNITNIAGAVVSFALIIGIAIWGYKLLIRDVSGIPVVKAASGEMRVRPEQPGGDIARHQGLSVNAVAAEGTAAKPADRLILAPRPIDLADEDQVMPVAMVAPAPQEAPALPTQPLVDAAQVATALETGNVDDLVAQLTAGVAPLADLGDDPQQIVAVVSETVVAEIAAAEQQVAALLDAPGLRQSIRPHIRPAVRAQVTPAAVTAILEDTQEVNPESLPAGTRLAQLGAFDSPEVAREQWQQMQNRFDAYMSGKRRIVQKATSGGRTFYRLRAMGFENIADARSFCSALVAANADCIPVVTR